jgi:hypothetical protein
MKTQLKLRLKLVLAVLGTGILAVGGFIIYQSDLVGGHRLGAELTGREGSVEYRTSATGAWKTATADISLAQAAQVRTGKDSRAIVNLDDGSAVRLAASSSATLDTLNSKHIVIKNTGGKIYTRVTKSAKRVFEVVTSKSTYRSLGTAYETIDTPEAEGVEVYHSKVSVLGATASGDLIVEQGSRYYRVNTAAPDAVGKVTEIDKAALTADDFVKWNADQDRKEFADQLGVLFDTTPPALEVSTPAAGLTTASDALDVTGTTEAGAKVQVNGVDAINTAGKFTLHVALAVGSNALKVESTDGAGNKTVKTLSVTRTAPAPVAGTTPAPAPAPAAKSFKLYGTRVDSGVSFSWTISGIAAPNGFKLVKSTSPNPVYPGNDYQYLSNSGTRSYTWGLKDGATYHFRICAYTGSGCDNYSNDITVTAPSSAHAEASPTGTLSLSHQGSGSVFSWALNGSAPYGYKLVWATHAAPVYPGDNYNYLSNPATTSASITTEPGTYYVRVCMYTGGGCTNYSNELSVIIP